MEATSCKVNRENAMKWFVGGKVFRKSQEERSKGGSDIDLERFNILE